MLETIGSIALKVIIVVLVILYVTAASNKEATKNPISKIIQWINVVVKKIA
mgnify:CR=1 FL=1